MYKLKIHSLSLKTFVNKTGSNSYTENDTILFLNSELSVD